MVVAGVAVMTTGSTRPRSLRLARWWLTRVWPATLLAVGILSLAALALPGVRFEFSLEDLFPRDSPHAALQQQAAERYGRDDGAIVMALEGDPFDPRLALAERLAGELPGVVSTVSPASWHVLDQTEPGRLEPRPLAPGDEDPLATGLLVARDGSAGAVLVRLDEAVNHHAGRDPVVAALEDIVEEVGGRWHLGGVPVIRVAYVRAMQADLARLLPLALLVSLVFFIDALRDWRHVLLCAGALILGTGLTGALLVLTRTPFTIFTPAMLAVVLVVGTSDLVHLVHRFAERFATADNTKATPGAALTALLSTLREVGLACLATSATTALGFLSLMATAIPQIRRFGLMTAMGVMAVFACSMLLVPPALARLGPPRNAASRRAARNQHRLRQLGQRLTRRPRMALWFAAGLVLFGLTGGLRVETDPHILGDVRSTDMARSNDFIEAHLGAVLPLDLEVACLREDCDVRHPDLLAAQAALVAWTRDRAIAGQVVGLPDLVGGGWTALGESGLPPTREAVSQVMLLHDLVDPTIVASFCTAPDASRIRARIRDEGHKATIALVEDLHAFAKPLLDPHGAELRVTGVAWLAQEINRTLTGQFGGSFVLALAVVGLLALFVYRRILLVGVALLPNALPLVALLGLMGWSGLGLQPSTAMVFSVAFGIAVDDTIHFLAVYGRHRRAGASARDAVVETTATVGRTLVDTSLLLAGGFAIFAWSEYGAMALFGVLTAFSVLVAAGSDLLVLGPLLVLLEGRSESQEPPSLR